MMTMAQHSSQQRRRRRRRRISTATSLWNAATNRPILILLLGITVLFTTLPHVVTAQGNGGKPCFSSMGRTTLDGASFFGPYQTCLCEDGNWINCYKNTYDDDDAGTALEDEAALEEEERDGELSIGNTVEDNDCPASAGYQWCPSLYQCYRPWEKTCEDIFAVCAGEEALGNCSCMANDFNVEASLVYKYCPELTSCIKGGCPKVYEDDDTSNSNEDIDDDLSFRDTEVPTAAPKVISLTALPTLPPVDDGAAITNAPTLIDLTEEPTYYPTTLAPIQPPEDPTFAPTVFIETVAPTTREPTPRPTSRPSQQPNPLPTTLPPTPEPTKEPTPEPTPEPTEDPTPEPTPEPTNNPTRRPTPRPSRPPTPRPSHRPTPRPSPRPSKPPVTPDPTPSGTLSPTDSPQPSFKPTRTFTDGTFVRYSLLFNILRHFDTLSITPALTF